MNEVNNNNIENNVAPDNNVNNINNINQPIENTPAPSVTPVEQVSSTPVATGIKAGIKIGSVNVGLKAIIAAAIALVLIIGGVVLKIATSTPKAVFSGMVNKTYKEVHKAIKEYDKLDKKFNFSDGNLYAKLDVKLDHDIEELKEVEDEYGISLKDYKLKGEMRVDTKEQKLLMGAGIESSKVDADIKFYLEENKVYMSTSLYDDVLLIDGEEMDIDFSEFEELFDMLSQAQEKVDTKDIDYLAKLMRDAINKSFDKEAFKKENKKVKVDGKKVSMTKYSYEMDDKVIKNMVEVIGETILDDKEAISILSDMIEVDKKEVKEAIEMVVDSADEIEFDGEIVINLFTRGLLNECSGMSLEVMGEEVFEVYTNGKVAEATLGSGDEAIEIVAKEEKKSTKVEVEVAGEKFAELEIRSYTMEKMDFDMTIIDPSSEEEIKASVYYTNKENKDSFTGDYKFKLEFEGEFLEISGTYLISTKEEPSVDIDDAVDINEVDPEEFANTVIEKLEKDEGLASLIEESMEQAEEERIQEQLNYYGMLDIEEDEAISLLSKSKPTVLYVGNYSYSYGTQEYNLYSSLRSLQNYNDFYSYALDSADVTEAFKEKVKDVEYSCALVQTPAEGEAPAVETTPETTTSCSEFPVIYIINDGKVVKGFRAGSTKTEIETALTEAGVIE